jgi:hypothetical protein
MSTRSDRVYRRARLATPVGVGATGAPAAADTWGQIVTPEELETLLGLEADEAARVAELVQITIEAYCWPNVIPDPVPPPVHAVGLALAARFAGAELSKAGSVVGETIGSYSYRLASPLTFDNVVTVLGELAEALGPWAPRHRRVYTLDTSGPPFDWPVDWWQRDLDRIYSGEWP